MIPVWRGSCNQWDCDEMGHMNVRVYAEKQLEGLRALAAAIRMPRAFTPGAGSTLLPVQQNIRFIREVHPGRPLSMHACITEIGESGCTLYQELRHGNGQVSAAFLTELAHVTALDHKPFAWPARIREALAALQAAAPPETAPRSLPLDGPCLSDGDAVLARAEAAGAPRIGLGALTQREIGPHGCAASWWVIGRISDSVPNLMHRWREDVGKAKGADGRTGAAVLEYRLVYRNWPGLGDGFAVHSALGQIAEKTHSLVHWVLDPETGRPWATCEALAVTFDLETRKTIAADPADLERLRELVPQGLSV